MSFTHTTKAASYTEGESLLTVRLVYHLWRVDSAVRAFPHHLVDDGDINRAKARWTIGLTLEMQGLRDSAADVTLLGAMTEPLSRELAKRIRWFDLGNATHTGINWDGLPKNETSEGVPSPPWMLAYEPHMISARNRWWEDNTTDGKPMWWNDANPDKWLDHVYVPRTLIGEYVCALQDSKDALTAMSSMLSKMVESAEQAPCTAGKSL